MNNEKEPRIVHIPVDVALKQGGKISIPCDCEAGQYGGEIGMDISIIRCDINLYAPRQIFSCPRCGQRYAIKLDYKSSEEIRED